MEISESAATEAGYDSAATERFVAESPKSSARSPFERDRARLVHSAALRRLAAKTQVVGPGTDDFVRNRLTHTLEVAQIARDLANRIGCDTDVVETAALAHDIGHPPFGHNGEQALNELSTSCGGFEGNAQTLRILTRLEAKRAGAGLNLTRATLDAATKYPWPRSERDPHKFGVYVDDLPVFTWLRERAPARRRCLEAQVMDLSDDIAYSVHDLEDGIVGGRIELSLLRDSGARQDVWQLVRDWYDPDLTDTQLDEALARLSTLPSWPTYSFDGSRRAQAALKDLTSDLIGRFCSAAESATHARHGGGPLVRYAADLVVPDVTFAEITVLKGIAAHYVMRADDRLPILIRQRELITELVAMLQLRGPDELEPAFRLDYDRARTDAAQLRVLIDQVASLTDASAVSWHQRLR
ncbi:MAG: deoxyguanosinetriphosphate triphosphohydrolase [Nocardioidaceae bacterium]|nr:MAG: deoxyguanosinetriphosphate triphosphohydrolase [Nocardioidaceae bacterium]